MQPPNPGLTSGLPRVMQGPRGSGRLGLKKLKGSRQSFLHIPTPARMFDPQRALRCRLMCSEHGRCEGCAARASRTRETSDGDVRVAQFAAVLRGVSQVTEQLKIGAALKKIVVESLDDRVFRLPAIDTRVTI
jgi:hypothetical protein